MKKLLTALSAIMIVGASATSVVACGKKDNTRGPIGLVTDAGKVTDKSFNQSAFEAGNNFYHDILKNKDHDIAYVEPKDLNDLENAYGNLVNAKDIGVLILPGFHHVDYMDAASATLKENKIKDVNGNEVNRTGILIDGFSRHDNVVGLAFRADMSGFYAGMASIIYEIQNNKEMKEVKLATFGGTHSALAVGSYMGGFLASIEVFNSFWSDKETREQFAKQFYLDKNREVKASRVASQISGPQTEDDKSWFTGNFDPGNAVDISKKLISEGADVILPVAGPQTSDVLSAINDTKASTKIVGVDTNQAEYYTDGGKDKFITSAEKDILHATEIAIAHTPLYANDEKVRENIKDLESQIIVTDKDGSPIIEEDWSEQTAWVGGDLSSGGKNLIKEEEAQDVKDFFENIIMEASQEYLSPMFEEGNNTVKFSLSKEVIDHYADTIFAYFKDIEEKK